jgi:hypothetical protein
MILIELQENQTFFKVKVSEILPAQKVIQAYSSEITQNSFYSNGIFSCFQLYFSKTTPFLLAKIATMMPPVPNMSRL